MDVLKAMQVFVTVADQSGFAPAAKSMGLSTSSVSRQIGNLEDQLGTQLFNRTTRHLSLTPAGEAFFGQCQRLVNDVDDLLTSNRREAEQPTGRLRVTMPVFVGSILMEEVISRFARDYPKVDLELLLVDRVVNLVEEGYDLAIRVGNLPDSSLVARKILDLRLALVASPDYVATKGKPEAPDELQDHPCIIETSAPYRDRWPLSIDGETRRYHVKSNVTVNLGNAARDLAIGGVGLALLPEYLVHQDIRDGRLVTVMDAHMLDFGGVSIVYPQSRHPSPAIRCLADLVVQHTKPIQMARERILQPQID